VKTVVLRHVAFEDLGSWAATLRQRGHGVSYLEPGDDLARADDADLLVVLGAPVGLSDVGSYPFLRDEIAVVARRLERDDPTIGVCLGAQVMAAALGANVYRGLSTEIGWGVLNLTDAAKGTPLAALGDAPVLHWHSDTFDLPSGAVHLASSGVTRNQAFSFGRSLALQFHCEVMGTNIERWLIGHAVELAEAKESVPALRNESLRHALPAARAGRQFLAAYLDSLGDEQPSEGLW
jgi:GMP synthase (glutamine-hydrolysing)